MYPATIFNWFDNSSLNVAEAIPVLDSTPLFFCVSSFDKGPEKLMTVEGSDFDALFGKVEFSKHGQPAIQAKRIIDAGGRILVKRVAATDATLANIIISANIVTTEVQKTNEDGEPLYYDEDGNETTEVTDDPVMVTTNSIKWIASKISGTKSFNEVKTAALALLDEENGIYPLFVFTDNGRGESSKAIRITADYNTSKNYGTMFYSLKAYEGTSIIESNMISLDPDVVLDETAYGVDLGMFRQIETQMITSVFDLYVAKLSNILGIDANVLRTYDLINGYDYTGVAIEGFVLDEESIDLNSTYGVSFGMGSNGAFGSAPVGKEAWADGIRAVFAGEVTTDIYDVDTYKIGAIVDANYPDNVKEAIASLVTFREDCVFFRDLGTGLVTFNDIREKYASFATKNKFIADYLTSYTIKDPTSKKNIEVTMMYDFAAVLVKRFNTNISAPLAGTYNGAVLDNAIKGTINFTPVITPSVNQKAALDDLKLNYAIFNGDYCIIQSCYSSQPKATELSFINNVLAVQEVMREIRTNCPVNRYKMVTGTDFSAYKKDCDTILDNFRNNFAVLNLVYTEDKIKAAQKIFYVSLEFAFDQWAQTEMFDMYILNSGNM